MARKHGFFRPHVLGLKGISSSTLKEGVVVPNTVWNPADKTAGATLSALNKKVTASVDGAGARSNLHRSAGKVYVEFKVEEFTTGMDLAFGLAASDTYIAQDFASYPNSDNDFVGFFAGANSHLFAFGDHGAIGGSAIKGAIVSLAVDIKNKKIWARIDGGTWNGNAGYNPATGVGGLDLITAGIDTSDFYLFFRGWSYALGAAPAVSINTGPAGFAYAVPAGFYAWDDPSIPFSWSHSLSRFQTVQFYDDFNSLSLRTGGPTKAGYQAGSGVWTPRYYYDAVPQGNSNYGNLEKQLFADPAYAWSGGYTPFSVAGSILTIRAQTTPAGIAAQVPNDPNTAAPYGYVSGMLTTKDSFTFTPPALIEMYAKIPKGKAIWPAFWTMPSNESWPPELDIMEYNGAQNAKLNLAAWYGTGGATSPHLSSNIDRGLGDLSLAYHKWGAALWEDGITFYIDDVEVYTLPNAPGSNFGLLSHYLLITLSVGGNFVDAPDGTTPSPADLLVDWVRVKGL